MTKKELLKHVNQYKDLKPRSFYHSSQFGRPGDYYIVTNEEGKAIDITNDREVWKKEKEEKDIQILAAQSLKKEDETRRKKTLKSKKELDEYKKDPSVLQEELDAKYLKYQEKVKEMKKWYSEAEDNEGKLLFSIDSENVVDKKKPEHAPGRVINRAKISALKDLYDTAKIYNSLKKDDDPTDYYGEAVKAVTGRDVIGGPKQKMETGLAKQKEMDKRFDPSKPFSTEPEIPTIPKEQYETLTDQEILDKLKLRQK